VKKRLADYAQMLQYYILMRTKNKMKDFDAKFEEWREVVEEYFVKGLGKNLAQHKLMRETSGTSWGYIKKKFQIFSAEVQQIPKHRTEMKIMK
jgi:hypothetical protein